MDKFKAVRTSGGNKTCLPPNGQNLYGQKYFCPCVPDPGSLDQGSLRTKVDIVRRKGGCDRFGVFETD